MDTGQLAESRLARAMRPLASTSAIPTGDDSNDVLEQFLRGSLRLLRLNPGGDVRNRPDGAGVVAVEARVPHERVPTA